MSIFGKLFKRNDEFIHMVEEEIKKDEEKNVDKVVIDFSSDKIEELSVDNFIDTTDPLLVAKYLSNIKLIEKRVLEEKKIGNLCLIRNDDFLPPDWTWRVNSKDTVIEKVSLNLSCEIRKEICRERVRQKKNYKPNELFFDIPVPVDELYKELESIDKTLGNVYMPARFRSTKHFTVNTALGYTGSYNLVDSDRMFTVIDSLDNFINSGYAYSISGRDAYLDITHKGLEISKNSIILIDVQKYETIKDNEVLMNQLRERRVVLYKGDINLAINMLLAENGILPFEPGEVSYRYDEEVYKIIEDTMKSLAASLDIYYDQGHGNIDGKGGHFSDLFDGQNMDYHEYKTMFADFLNNKFNLNGFLNNVNIDKPEFINKVIKEVGVDNLLKAIEEFNAMMIREYPKRYTEYVKDRNTITESDDILFKETLKLIRDYYEDKGSYGFSMEEHYYVTNLIKTFFHSNKVDMQVSSAKELNKLLYKKKCRF